MSLETMGKNIMYNLQQFEKEETKEETKEEKHQDLLNYLHNLYVTKNHDYGDSVHDTFVKYGLTSFLVRIEDKLNRARTLSTKEALVNDEKIEDTLLDMANYAIIAVLELKNSRQAEKK